MERDPDQVGQKPSFMGGEEQTPQVFKARAHCLCFHQLNVLSRAGVSLAVTIPCLFLCHMNQHSWKR